MELDSHGACVFEYDHHITKSILETSLDAAFTIRHDGVIVDVNSAATRLFGWSATEFLGRNISMIVAPPHQAVHDGYLRDFNPRKGISHILGNGRLLKAQRKDGSLFPVEVGISSFEREGKRFFTGFVRDMSERQSYVDQLHWQATRDDETQLLNYRGLLDLEHASAAHLADLFCMTIQLQSLARCIAAQGRDAGLHVIKTLAGRIESCIANQGEPRGVLARTAADAFTLFAGGDILPLVQRIQEAVNAPIAYESVSLQVRARIGISTPVGPLEERYRQGVIASERVDTACGGFQEYSLELCERLQRELLIESRLRDAVPANALRLMLQPKICLRTGQVDGAEALVRWMDPELGAVSPVEFIPIAERTGQIAAITEWMLQQSLLTIRAYAPLGLSVAVNFSAIDFQQHDMVQKVQSALSQAQVDARQLVIELTESAVADDPANTARRMQELKDLGVSISLDDFGTGYSSLSYLRQFPIDSLKIDASFVRHTPGNADANAIATAIAAMAKALNLDTIAEGVETREQSEFLTALGVDLCQGYLFARPLSPAQFQEFVLGRGTR